MFNLISHRVKDLETKYFLQSTTPIFQKAQKQRIDIRFYFLHCNKYIRIFNSAQMH